MKQLKQFSVKLRAEIFVSFKSDIKYLAKITNKKGYKDDNITTEAIEKIKTPSKTIGDLHRSALSGLRQFLATESPLKIMKHAFYFTLKAVSVLKILSFCHNFLVM